ncbi:MAG: PD-(D/E)XK nuclease family protein [Bacteroidota bacterium]
MKKFLEKVVEEIIANESVIDDNIWLIIPNRRGIVFLKKYFSEHISNPVFSPTILPIEDFIKQLSDKFVLENDVLLFELYSIIKDKNLPFSNSFEEFLSVGNSMLHDFNEIDLYLANAKEVFTEINRIKAIELWSPERHELTELQTRYLAFYNSLYDIYIEFNKHLDKSNHAYQGKAYRYAYENIENNKFKSSSKSFYFCGFNALTKSEEKIIKHFSIFNKSTIFWNSDEYYALNNINEAGKFIREQKIQTIKETNWIEKDYKEIDKEINVIGVSQKVGQAKAVGQILSNLSKEEIEKTAIVLADETLLQPLLNSIPDNIEKINITMGLPLKVTPSFSFFDSLIRMHLNSYKLTKNEDSSVFYHKDIITLFSHPYFNNFIQTDSRFVIKELIRKNKVFISINEVNYILRHESDKQLIELLFSKWNNKPEVAIAKILQFISTYKEILLHKIKEAEGSDKFSFKLNLEYLFSFYKIFNRINGFIEKYDAITNVKTFYKLFQQISYSNSISFFGEPLEGLQIMGILETRVLDFENLIMLSINENILPTGKSFNSLIPYEVKKANEIPTFTEKDSVFAYHFYRLIQKSKNIHLIYDCDSKSETNEKSRFILQLENELPKYNSNTKINQSFFSYNPDVSAGDSISISKSDDILNRIKEIAQKGFSPSAINTYISCPLRFYFRYITKLDDNDEIQENVDAPTIGNIFHEVLHQIYSKYINIDLTSIELKSNITLIEDYLIKAFEKYFPNGNYNEGKNLLTRKVTETLLETFINLEVQKLNEGNKIRILHLEKSFEKELVIDGLSESIKIKGIIDRIDEFNKTIRIIDYKTGIVQPASLKIKHLEDIMASNKYDKVVQLMIYQLLYSSSNIDTISGIISFKNIQSYLQELKVETDNIPQFYAEFEAEIKSLILELFSPETQFSQTEDKTTCSYCSFNNICVR